WADPNIAVGPLTVGHPQYFPRSKIETRQSATHAKFAAAIAHINFVFNNESRSRGGFAETHVAGFRAPYFFPGVCIDCNRCVIERVVDDFAVSIAGATVYHVAASPPLRSRIGVRLIFPL